MDVKKQLKRNIIWSIFFVISLLLCVLVVHKLYSISVQNDTFTLHNYSIIIISIFIIISISEIIYFIISLIGVYKQNNASESALANSKYMYKIQEVLFDAYKKPDKITDALNYVAEAQNAEAAFLLNIRGQYISRYYIGGRPNNKLKDFIEGIYSNPRIDEYKLRLQSGESIVNYVNPQKTDSEEIAIVNRNLLRHDIKSIMLVPIMDNDNMLESVLACVNMTEVNTDTTFLKSIAVNFLMVIKNIESYGIVCEMGTIDTLTGLQNQNSYQYALIDYSTLNCKNLCCIYIDANGLHEVNNTLGHTAGDDMLRFIGSTIKSMFGSQNTYRIGGDEFVVIAVNEDKTTINQKLDKLRNETSKEMYDISIGVAWLGENTNHIDKLSAEAEQYMYEDKRLFYKRKGNGNKIRLLNDKLEHILTEKKDTDNFLSIIANYFMGVYVVDFSNDNARIIYSPDYFKEFLDESDSKFKPALNKYIDKYSHEDDRKKFYSFASYPNIEKLLNNGEIPEFRYKKPDGKNVLLRVYRPQNNFGKSYETFWLFEEFN